VDVRPGGRFRIQSPALGVTVSGVYTAVEPPRRLSFTWVWDDGEQGAVEDAVKVAFDPEPGGTRVTVAHTSAAHVPEGGAEQGWSDVLDRLARVVGQPSSSRS
jgi:uncharacterized protein YndB with AHSA1/START domain